MRYHGMSQSLVDFDVETLADELRRRGHNGDHAARILRAYYGAGGQVEVDALPILKSLRQLLKDEYGHRCSRVIARHESSDGTVKLLLGFDAGGTAETVLMPSPTHRAGV